MTNPLYESLRLVLDLPATVATMTMDALRLHTTPPISGERVPVLVLPGLLADDLPTVELRRYLSRCGHHVEGWRLGHNLGPTSDVLEELRKRLAEMYAAAREPVALVGWSLGGIYARWLAHTAPEQVRQVIALGSPWAVPTKHKGLAACTYGLVNMLRETQIDAVLELSRLLLPCPSLAIYSLTDTIAASEHCVELAHPDAESVEVRGGHFGLITNPEVAVVIARRLAQPTWREAGRAA